MKGASCAARIAQPRSARSGPAVKSPVNLQARRPLANPLRASSVVEERLSGSDVQAWQDSKLLIEALGFSDEDAEGVMQRSFGWAKASQSFWRGSLVEQVPSTDQVQAVIDYLAEIGIKGNDLVKYVGQFPYIFGCDIEELLKANVNELEKTWKIKGATLTATLKRRPEILGYNLDCYGDCKGECNRCWVRF